MICLDVQERLSAYLDSDLSPEEMEEIAEHLRGCQACQAVLSELRQVRDELRSLPEVEIPRDLHSSVMQNLRPHLKPKKKVLFNLNLRSWGYRQWVQAAAVAMVLVMFISFGGGLWYAGRLAGESGGIIGAKAEEGSEGAGSQSKSRGAAVESPPPAASPDYSASSGQKTVMTAAPNDTFGTQAVGTGPEILSDTSRKIIRRAQLTLEVARGGVKKASAEAVRIVQSNFGYVENSSTTQSDGERKEITNFFMVARVPAANLDTALQELSQLGRTVREETSAQDITDTYVDLDARLRNKENQEARLLQIMGQAQTVGELLQVEGELSRVRGDIESMKAQKLNYDKAVDLSTVTLSILEEGAASPKVPSQWAEVWRIFVESWRALAVFLARVAPAAIFIVVIAGIGVSLARRSKSQ